jgi:membrane protease YdiL (CAAX protease family)
VTGDVVPGPVPSPAVRAPLPIAAGAWATAWIVGGLVFGGAALAAMDADFDALTVGQISVTAALSWLAFAVALVVVSKRVGSGDLRSDYRIAVRPVDVVAVPIGVVGQLVLIPALYWPLQQVWPDTFSDDQLEERAVELAERATGSAAILLVVVVVVGAPVFEELVYRGLLQRSLVGVAGRVWGLLAAAAWFSLIHLAPVEFPGLFLAGLLFGGALLITDRLGPAILLHAAFNATGLVLAYQAA